MVVLLTLHADCSLFALTTTTREAGGGGAEALARPEAGGEQVGDTPVDLAVAVARALCPGQSVRREGLTDATTTLLLMMLFENTVRQVSQASE
jgi:hypothetical protein